MRPGQPDPKSRNWKNSQQSTSLSLVNVSEPDVMADRTLHVSLHTSRPLPQGVLGVFLPTYARTEVNPETEESTFFP